MDLVTKRRRRMVSPDRRKKVTQACDSCKRRKQKCNGGAPCNTCASRDVECVYSEIDRRSLKSLKTHSATPVQSLNENFAHFHSLSPDPFRLEVATVLTAPSFDPPRAKSYIPASLQPLLSFPIEYPDDHVPCSDNGLFAHTGSGDTEADNDAHSASVHNLSISRMVSDTAGNFRYMGESSTLSLLSQTRKIYLRVLGPSRYTDDPLRIHVHDFPHALSSKRTLQLPLRAFTDHLVLCFQDCVNELHHIFDMAYLKNVLIEGIYSDPISATPRQLCLLHLVCAVGAVYANIARDFPGNMVPAEEFFQNGIHFIHQSVENGNLWLVEAYTLIYLYYQSVCKLSTAWVFLGTAIRFAQALGMDKQPVNDSFANKSYALHRRKLWRSLYIHDRLVSSHLGRNFTIEDYQWTDYNNIPPAQCEPALGTSEASKIVFRERCEHELLRVCRILGRVTYEVYLTPRVDVRRARLLAVELKLWAIHLPPDLQVRTLLRENRSGYYTDCHPLHLLHLTHLHAIMVLSRPFCNFHILAHLGFLRLNRRSRQFEVMEMFYEALLKAALLTIKLSEYIFEENVPPLKPRLLFNYVFHSGLMVGMVLLVQQRGKLEPAEASKCDLPVVLCATLGSAIRVLQAWAEVDLIAKRYSYILRDMLEAFVAGESVATAPVTTVDSRNGPDKSDSDAQVPPSLFDSAGANDLQTIDDLLDFQNWIAMADSTTHLTNGQIYHTTMSRVNSSVEQQYSKPGAGESVVTAVPDPIYPGDLASDTSAELFFVDMRDLGMAAFEGAFMFDIGN
ncbi:hypothetical protein BABINDRAFT_163451 [Babjeviella inositovora NRRL Y-12698]|uniref:Zn(2)-C6 fungal-type domain-containing protein n=1 Tax=Babjeviella inositovora NRRL Y-12698 TaxID=984486 RepID=A0A1E3QKA0_9ASCO|nr:uncharacterized protein BABINDRAFT_163451 [Babjeviella inositovora NRRL Y-12698]ODQ77427.1 hypothetical protein BABINDRAFT_163451 [Babjeviella inositovora NRRL Y-12698]